MEKRTLLLCSLVLLQCLATVVYGQTTLQLSGIIRDHTPSRNPDFEYSGGARQGLVQSVLGGGKYFFILI